MENIKFRYMFQSDKTGDVMFQFFTIEQIEGSNFIEQCKKKFGKHWFIAGRDLYINRNDKYNNEIYEHDIVEIEMMEGVGEEKGRIVWDCEMAGFYWKDKYGDNWKLGKNEMKVVTKF